MNGSDRLRVMLDELGVEYRIDDASYTFATHWADSLGRGCSFVEEVYNGESKTIFVSEPSARNITPEQAIAATLGDERIAALEALVRDMFDAMHGCPEYGDCEWCIDHGKSGTCPFDERVFKDRMRDLGVM